ncbi:basal transcription factor [Cryptosporidium canis]|uniref:Nascent polypeptide-associated complex subunit beta n=1 Tax=Cryptosporidium canis TaxID=195482 RepID=A0ABQ8P9F3_9CRYT|nr:basal transcription factor [Cryptosporidium canis]KAJ1613564.1 basal transcription factor [Cryptosporidium canis]
MKPDTKVDETIEQARQKLRDRFGAGATQVGGKGTVRRKKRGQKPTTVDVKRIQVVTSRFRCQNFPAIGEVTMMKKDGTCLHFSSPKLQASVATNTFILSGNSQEKLIKDLPQQINPMDLSAFLSDPKFQKLLEESQANRAKMATKEDDDIPNLVENFEDVEG